MSFKERKMNLQKTSNKDECFYEEERKKDKQVFSEEIKLDYKEFVSLVEHLQKLKITLLPFKNQNKISIEVKRRI